MSDTSPRDNSIHDAIDALFDGEMTDADARHLVSSADPEACETIAKTQRIVDQLKAPVKSPDLTASILQQVEDEREYVASPWRRFVRAGRLGVAACLLFTLLSVAVAQRLWPEATTLQVEPRPVSTLLHATEQQAVRKVRAINESLEAADQGAIAVRAAVVGSRAAPQKISSSDRHVFVMAAETPVYLTTDVVLAEGAGAQRFESEALVWRARGPHLSDEHVSASTFRSGMAWSFDLDEVVQLQLLKREAEPVELRSTVFRSLP